MFVSFYRGMRAFIKYVPRDAVMLMLRGEMSYENIMVHRILTILFMDIAGFSTLCEKVAAEQLMRLITDYLQAMCHIIVSSAGTLDKVETHKKKTNAFLISRH